MERADALRIMQLLTAAYPTHPLTADTTELYVATMMSRTPDVTIAFSVAQDWTTAQLYFPKLAEFLEAYGSEATRRERAARVRIESQRRYRPGTVACTSCDDSGMETWAGENGVEWTAPCSSCRPDERTYWREGHFDPGHDTRSCSHPRCEERSRSRRKVRT